MRIIAITTPAMAVDDVVLIRRLLERGVDIVHLRKPDADAEYCRAVLSALTVEERSRIVIHDYAELYAEFSLLGIHQNRNIGALPAGYRGLKTRSCHTIEEVVRYKDECDYLFLSPIFDSISKEGCLSGFGAEELKRYATEGIIDDRVVALGGVTIDKIAYLRSLGFGGVAMVGALYNKDALATIANFDTYK